MFESLVAEKQGNANRRGNRGGDITKRLGYSYFSQSKTGAGRKYSQVAFYIGRELMKSARFMLGDRLDILYDSDSGLGLIKRMPNNSVRGNKLSGSKSNACGTFQVSSFYGPFPETPNGVISLENVSVDNEGILFTWPK